MKLPRLLVVSVVSLSAFTASRPDASASGTELATQRRVHGVITAVDGATLTIATEKATVTGKLDPSRTRVMKNGKPARASDLHVTAHARAELCLDDVWTVVDEH